MKIGAPKERAHGLSVQAEEGTKPSTIAKDYKVRLLLHSRFILVADKVVVPPRGSDLDRRTPPWMVERTQDACKINFWL